MPRKTVSPLPECRSHCPISYALDFVGDKWTLLVLRDLIFARKRYFQDFLESREGIASNILASRLKLLEAGGFVTRAPDPQHARRVIYAPTAKALDLLPAMLELIRWSAKYDAKTEAPAHLLKGAARNPGRLAARIRAQHET